jgi:hypothetical protein
MAKKKSNSTTVPVEKHAKDSKNYFRYVIGEEKGEIVGSLYISRKAKKVPKKIVLDLSDAA